MPFAPEWKPSCGRHSQPLDITNIIVENGGSAVKKEIEAEEKNQASKNTASLVKKANNGDKDANDQLWKQLDADGRAEIFVRSLTDTACRVREIKHDSLILRTAFQRKMKQIRKELGFETASPLERLLIERIVLCWFHLHETEVNYTAKMKESMSLERATYLQKSLDRAETRYQASVKSLAVLRRLQLPAVQVNIGEKQINVLQGGIATSHLPNSADPIPDLLTRS